MISVTCRTPPNTQLALYADDTAILAQSWRTDTIVHRLTHATSVLLRYFTRWKLQVNIHKTEAILFTRRRPAVPAPRQFQHTAIPWNSQVRYLGLLLDPKLLFTRHLTLRLLISYIYGAPSKVRNANVVYIYMDLRLATLKQSLSICCTMFQH